MSILTQNAHNQSRKYLKQQVRRSSEHPRFLLPVTLRSAQNDNDGGHKVLTEPLELLRSLPDTKGLLSKWKSNLPFETSFINFFFCFVSITMKCFITHRTINQKPRKTFRFFLFFWRFLPNVFLLHHRVVFCVCCNSCWIAFIRAVRVLNFDYWGRMSSEQSLPRYKRTVRRILLPQIW